MISQCTSRIHSNSFVFTPIFVRFKPRFILLSYFTNIRIYHIQRDFDKQLLSRKHVGHCINKTIVIKSLWLHKKTQYFCTKLIKSVDKNITKNVNIITFTLNKFKLLSLSFLYPPGNNPVRSMIYECYSFRQRKLPFLHFLSK